MKKHDAATREKKILAIASGLSPRLIRIRRDIHRHPELAFQEERTSRRVAEILRSLDGVRVQSGVAGTGVIGLLEGAQAGRTVALRADMDALPIAEANDVSYRSRNTGVMHACGHDGHTAMLLGSAMILSRLRRGIKGNVKFLFQPAEETVGGAEAMIRAGCLERPRVDAVFALHLRPSKPFGAVAIRPGPMSAAALQFLITVKGRGGHAAGPHATIDPLVAANHIYQAFHTLSRNIDALDPCVVSVCSFHAGTAFNVIPDDAEMKGTIRTYKTSVEATIRRRMRAIVRGAAQAFGAKCRIEFIEGTRAVVNNAALTRLVLAASRRLGLRVVDVAPSMGSEDFSCYLKSAPGAFIRLGTQKGAAIRLQHSSKFDFDDTVLAKGAALLSECALLSLAEA